MIRIPSLFLLIGLTASLAFGREVVREVSCKAGGQLLSRDAFFTLVTQAEFDPKDFSSLSMTCRDFRRYAKAVPWVQALYRLRAIEHYPRWLRLKAALALDELLAPRNFASVPAGAFWMGMEVDDAEAKSNEARRLVRLSRDYSLSKFPVTQLQFWAVTGTVQLHRTGEASCPGTSIVIGDRRICPNNPAYGVLKSDVTQFFIQLNELRQALYQERFTAVEEFRLPTEAEWEKAFRAGRPGPYPMCQGGSLDLNTLVRCGWFSQNSQGRTHDVGEHEANPLGLHMLEGVKEWVADAYQKHLGQGQLPDQEVVDPLVEAARINDFYVIRGANCMDDALACRASYRSSNSGGARPAVAVGFRVAYTNPAPEAVGLSSAPQTESEIHF